METPLLSWLGHFRFAQLTLRSTQGGVQWALRNLSSTSSNCRNLSYLQREACENRSPVSKHPVVIFTQKYLLTGYTLSTSSWGQQARKAQSSTIVWEVSQASLHHSMLLPNPKVRSILFLVKLSCKLSLHQKHGVLPAWPRKSKYEKLLGWRSEVEISAAELILQIGFQIFKEESQKVIFSFKDE